MARSVEVQSKVILATGTVWMAFQERVHWACLQSHCFSSRALLAVTRSCEEKETRNITNIGYIACMLMLENIGWSSLWVYRLKSQGYNLKCILTSSSQLRANDVMSSWSSCKQKHRHTCCCLVDIKRKYMLNYIQILMCNFATVRQTILINQPQPL